MSEHLLPYTTGISLGSPDVCGDPSYLVQRRFKQSVSWVGWPQPRRLPDDQDLVYIKEYLTEQYFHLVIWLHFSTAGLISFAVTPDVLPPTTGP